MIVKTVTLTIDTYDKSFALRLAINDRMEKLRDLLASQMKDTNLKKEIQKDLKELEGLSGELDKWI